MNIMNTRDALHHNIIRTYEKLSTAREQLRCAAERSSQTDHTQF